MPTYLSRKAFADSQGWSPSYVTKLGSQGRLVMSPDSKQVNVDATLALIGKTADPAKEGVRQHHEEQRMQRDVYDRVRTDAPDTGDADVSDFHKARAEKEKYLAKMARVEFDKVSGLTVERQRVHAAAHDYGRLVRDTVLGVPRQVAADLAVVSDPWELERLLTQHLRKALEDIAKLGQDDLNHAMN